MALPRLIAAAYSLSLLAGCAEEQRRVPTGPGEVASVATPETPATPPAPIVEQGRIAFVSNRDGADAIYVANADGSGVTRLAAGERPAWAPGGRQLAFQRAGNIYIIGADGSREVRVTAGYHPKWSPDGSTLAFSANSSINTINADGSGARRVFDAATWNTADAEYSAAWPSWSPDGRQIAFIRTSYDDGWALYAVDVEDKTDPRPLVGEGVAENTSWSSDGSRIAFGYTPFRRGPPGPLVFMVGVVLTTGSGVIDAVPGFNADWTPAGNLVFNQFTGPGTTSNSRGSAMRIFVSTSPNPLIPEAAAPARPDYWDKQPAWAR